MQLLFLHSWYAVVVNAIQYEQRSPFTYAVYVAICLLRMKRTKRQA
jgi:hypothetical protein